jgi:hypothetical protein
VLHHGGSSGISAVCAGARDPRCGSGQRGGIVTEPWAPVDPGHAMRPVGRTRKRASAPHPEAEARSPYGGRLGEPPPSGAIARTRRGLRSDQREGPSPGWTNRATDHHATVKIGCPVIGRGVAVRAHAAEVLSFAGPGGRPDDPSQGRRLGTIPAALYIAKRDQSARNGARFPLLSTGGESPSGRLRRPKPVIRILTDPRALRQAVSSSLRAFSRAVSYQPSALSFGIPG